MAAIYWLQLSQAKLNIGTWIAGIGRRYGYLNELEQKLRVD